MSHRVSEKTRRKQRRGEGHGADYRPEIRVSEVPGHLGTNLMVTDWKNGRPMHFLSMGEAMWYYTLRWNDDVIDIREQYPLPVESTSKIAEEYRLRHPCDKNGRLISMTVDLVADYSDGHSEAYSVKVSKKDFEAHPSQVKNVFITKVYCESIGMKFSPVYTEGMNKAYAQNIMRIVQYWHPETVEDKVSLFKFMLAHKFIKINLKSDVIDVVTFKGLADEAISDNQLPELLKQVEEMKKTLKP